MYSKIRLILPAALTLLLTACFESDDSKAQKLLVSAITAHQQATNHESTSELRLKSYQQTFDKLRELRETYPNATPTYELLTDQVSLNGVKLSELKIEHNNYLSQLRKEREEQIRQQQEAEKRKRFYSNPALAYFKVKTKPFYDSREMDDEAKINLVGKLFFLIKELLGSHDTLTFRPIFQLIEPIIQSIEDRRKKESLATKFELYYAIFIDDEHATKTLEKYSDPSALDEAHRDELALLSIAFHHRNQSDKVRSVLNKMRINAKENRWWNGGLVFAYMHIDPEAAVQLAIESARAALESFNFRGQSEFSPYDTFSPFIGWERRPKYRELYKILIVGINKAFTENYHKTSPYSPNMDRGKKELYLRLQQIDRRDLAERWAPSTPYCADDEIISALNCANQIAVFDIRTTTRKREFRKHLELAKENQHFKNEQDETRILLGLVEAGRVKEAKNFLFFSSEQAIYSHLVWLETYKADWRKAKQYLAMAEPGTASRNLWDTTRLLYGGDIAETDTEEYMEYLYGLFLKFEST
ncbi:hypothetical protein [Paraferrimonas sedimenticola]|uniref:Lipoprotein n=1 Tax=Paraferrimonas sedimenticola TaxID=375674 RepID=A0AA37RT90_9GAMM|nr:hypothetical protein [Paraferrimonas sedimenticola]GLP94697.1 hypothetical protein GCM10007895_00030 [Paraferrimonas sedimenticola]